MPEETEKKPRSVWPFAIIGSLIAGVWAVVASSGNLSDLPSPDGTPEGGARLMGQIVGYAFGSAVFAAGIVWLAFYLLFFRKRVSAAKSGVTFVIMMIVALVLAAPARLVAVGVYNDGRRAAIVEWQTHTSQRATALSNAARAQVAALHLEQHQLAAVQNLQDVDEAVSLVGQAITIQEGYEHELEALIDTSMHEFDALPLSETEKAPLRADVDSHFIDFYRRDADLGMQAMKKAQETLEFMHDASGHWSIQNHIVVFDDEGALAHFRTLNDEMRAIQGQIQENAASRGGAQAEPAPTSTGSAPPPPR